ncbi:MAG TPA: radical SAM family heme chaperone HemW [Vicinamibacterales bacterium]|nr:radical SAM family heme chaperone HemW [Vicinamibacterales bacterium]
MLGLYLHVPFCSAICNYCNFNRGLFDPHLKDAYVEALEREIRAAAGDGADTIYFGGGTPSLLEPREAGRLIAACVETFSLAPATEITLETNPETVDAARLAAFRDAGVNRISFGVQSFHDAELKRLGRIHDARRARAAFSEARSAGFDNVSLDLMMWLPGQTTAEWQENVRELIALGPEHASLYILELYPNAPLKEDMARAGWSQAPDDDAAEMYEWSMETLEGAGYGQYEISNVARPGRESRHNLKYWQDGEWLGFGCGAHSTRDGVRWRNLASTGEYVARIRAGESPVAERRNLSAVERLEEALFTGLRLAAGVDVEEVGTRYGTDVRARYGPALAPFADQGLVVWEGRRLRLTRPGMLLANEILSVFV